MIPETGESVPVTALRIGFGRRLGALLLDALVIGIVTVIVYAIAGSSFEPLIEKTISAQLEEQNVALADLDSEQAEMIAGYTKMGILMGLIAAVVAFLYSFTEVLAAATPGKMMLGIKIANADATAASTSTLATRWFVKTGLSTVLNVLGTVTAASILSTLATIIGFVIFVGCFFVLGANRQALHDIIAKTAVYRRENIQDSPSLP